ncbi:MAG: hypothetical protein K8S56_02360 [Candidatus Cloacimonetes bacterium]|nr:hypothetical protein [Candidatus Cloacimonadota bacterium]
MKERKALLFMLIIVLFIFISCKKDSTGSNNNAVATETWDISIETRSSGTWTLELQTDGTITSYGSWSYGSEVSCPYTNAPMIITGSDFTMDATGTAHHSEFNVDSQFTLSVTGTFNNGTAAGEYVIEFSENEWPETTSGVWTGTLASGEGVTPTDP